jgi:hypothetical protein
MIIQAPWVNLVEITSSSTTKVTTVPSPLTTSP